jgi:hypothetical protein
MADGLVLSKYLHIYSTYTCYIHCTFIVCTSLLSSARIDLCYISEKRYDQNLQWKERKTWSVYTFLGSATPCACPPPQPSIFSHYSFRVYHPVNLDDLHLLLKIIFCFYYGQMIYICKVLSNFSPANLGR